MADLLPAWIGPDGLPLSWRHFRYAMRYLGRAHMRQQLAQAQAIRLGSQAGEEAYRDWQRDFTRMTTPAPDVATEPPRTLARGR